MTTHEQAQDRLPRWRAAEAVRHGWREHNVTYPPVAVLLATLPKGVLQIVFFTILGGTLAGPEQREYAFVGGLALALTTTNVVTVISVPFADKYYGTFWRVRLADMPAAAILHARALPYLALAFALFLVEGVVASLILGMGDVALRLVPWLWIYAIMACGYALLGIAASTATIAKRADAIAPNVLGYLTILCSGAFLPPGQVALVDAIGSVLPVRHGLQAVHSALAGAPWVGQALLEALICLASGVLGLLAVALQSRRAAKHGHDDFE